MLHFLIRSLLDSPADISSVHLLVLRGLLACCTAGIFGWFAVRYLISFLVSKQVTETSKDFAGLNPRSKKGTPTMGGVGILVAMYGSVILWCDLTNPFVHLVGLCGLVFGALGVVDDFSKFTDRLKGLGLSQRKKYVIEFGLSLALALLLLSGVCLPIGREALALFYVPFTKGSVSVGPALYLLIIIPFFVFCSNAVNITDGLDGLAIFPVICLAVVLALLAAIVGLPASAGLLHFTHLPGAAELAVFLAALIGASGAFLWFNAYPASIFMGDTGALALGAMLAATALVIKQEILFLIAGGLFVVEALSSGLQFYIGLGLLGRRLFFRAPLHHSWQYQGLCESKVAVRFWIIAMFLGACSLASLGFRW